MPLLTKGDLQKTGAVTEKITDTLPPPPVVEEATIRMHHPETTTDKRGSNLYDCEFELDGERIEVKKGVAVVTPSQAKRLEQMEWRRGKDIGTTY
jgi:hypothetical protein